jgi:hypothetical protein
MGLFGNKRKETEEKMREYYKYLKMGGASIKGKMSDKVKGKVKGIKEPKSLFSKLLNVFVILLIICEAFFPFAIGQAIWTVGIVIVIIIAALILLAIFAPEALGVLGVGGGQSIFNIVLALALVFIVLLVTQSLNCGQSSCYELFSLKIGLMFTWVMIIVLLIIGLLIAWFLDGIPFFIVAAVFAFLIFFIMPYMVGTNSYFKLCSKIPFLPGTVVCKTKEVYVEPIKTVKIPVAGGIGLKFGTQDTNWQPASTLYAGEPYEFTFILTNYYDEVIDFKLTPEMLSSYAAKLVFVQPFDQKTDSLKVNEFYQDSVLMDPAKMTIENTNTCPYNSLQISRAQNIDSKDVVCADGKPCENPKMGCVKIGAFECDCADWAKATCSKNSLNAYVKVHHTGFFRGNASLYYSNEMASPQPASELIQGPLSVIIEFQPNPYISTIHQYRQDVSMYVTFKNLGGDITIKDFKVEPQNTVIHTVDKEKGLELVEEVGTQVISYRNIEEIIPSGLLPNGEEASGKLCTLTPPSVKLTVKDLNTNQVTEIDNVTYDRISYYCDKIKPEADQTGHTSWSSSWDKIYQAIESSGMCNILKGKDTQQKATIESSLTHVDVVVEFTYERDAVFKSSDISPYTRTEECRNLQEGTTSTSITTTPSTV